MTLERRFMWLVIQMLYHLVISNATYGQEFKQEVKEFLKDCETK